MKTRNLLLITLCFTFLMFSCDNNDDIIIPDPIIGQTFEVENINFIAPIGVNDVTVNVPVPNSIEVFDSDVALVFILDPITTASEGIDVFEPLPRIFFFDNAGFAQYRFNFIFDQTSGIFDLDLTLESDDLAGLDASFTNNQIFRIVIVPSEFASAPENQNLTLGQVMSKLNLEL